MASSTSSPVLLWKCKCGDVEIKLHNKPWGCANCHCHSCVAVVRKADELGGASASSHPVGGGAAKAFFYLRDIELPSNVSEKLGYFKVGENGMNVRTYTKCCNTLLITAGGKHFPVNFRPLNRNCLINIADGSKFEWNHPVVNGQRKFAFDPSVVPEPNLEGMPDELVEKFAAGKVEADGNAALEKEQAIFCDPSDTSVEVVPITWE